MSQSIVVYQGANFVVELQSMYGSSNYGWCLSGLPKGIILLGTENVKLPSPYPIGPVSQKFYFGAGSCDQPVTLEFVLTASCRLQDIQDTYTVDVQVVPADTQQFVPYSENAAPAVKYGYVCDSQNQAPALKYGYPCADQMQTPFLRPNAQTPFLTPNAQTPFLKPNDQTPFLTPNAQTPFLRNDDQTPVLKYGYPCADPNQIPVMKYGYPCGYNDAVSQAAPGNDVDTMKTAMPYGMVYVTDELHK